MNLRSHTSHRNLKQLRFTIWFTFKSIIKIARSYIFFMNHHFSNQRLTIINIWFLKIKLQLYSLRTWRCFYFLKGITILNLFWIIRRFLPHAALLPVPDNAKPVAWYYFYVWGNRSGNDVSEVPITRQLHDASRNQSILHLHHSLQ